MFTAAEVGAANRRAAGQGAPGRGAPEELQVRSGGRSRGPAEAGELHSVLTGPCDSLFGCQSETFLLLLSHPLPVPLLLVLEGAA
ncbi:unnamed protein product [Rangifer tarandus platyrhynchus]|uniref:Uncharacterized protein n=1 Tax=Rangifer tarandus platyrhynchus TaxID=3082113 RepID=A0AC59Y9P5_RANTA